MVRKEARVAAQQLRRPCQAHLHAMDSLGACHALRTRSTRISGTAHSCWGRSPPIAGVAVCNTTTLRRCPATHPHGRCQRPRHHAAHRGRQGQRGEGPQCCRWAGGEARDQRAQHALCAACRGRGGQGEGGQCGLACERAKLTAQRARGAAAPRRPGPNRCTI